MVRTTWAIHSQAMRLWRVKFLADAIVGSVKRLDKFSQ